MWTATEWQCAVGAALAVVVAFWLVMEAED